MQPHHWREGPPSVSLRFFSSNIIESISEAEGSISSSAILCGFLHHAILHATLYDARSASVDVHEGEPEAVVEPFWSLFDFSSSLLSLTLHLASSIIPHFFPSLFLHLGAAKGPPLFLSVSHKKWLWEEGLSPLPYSEEQTCSASLKINKDFHTSISGHLSVNIWLSAVSRRKLICVFF